MSGNDAARQTLSLLKGYLEELQASGVDALPYAGRLPEGGSAAALPPAVSAPAAAAEPIRVTPASGESLQQIQAELGNCQRCALGKGRTTLVFGVGNPQARLVFVGEAPGRDEDLQGEPFVGEAGRLLTRLLNRMGLDREDVYICNVLKCRPPGNRNPEPPEIEQCSPFLLRQIRSIGPDAIVALGTFAAQTLLGSKAPISKMRGHFHDYHVIPLMPTFHPSFLLHNRNDTEKYWLVWDDMVQVLKRLGLPVPDVKRKG